MRFASRLACDRARINPSLIRLLGSVLQLATGDWRHDVPGNGLELGDGGPSFLDFRRRSDASGTNFVLEFAIEKRMTAQ